MMRNEKFCLSPALRMIAMGVLLLAAGCTTSRHFASVTQLESSGAGLKIALMPLDVQLVILTAGGVPEPQAEWTEAARRHMSAAIVELESSRAVRFVEYRRLEGNDPDTLKLNELEHLHAAVGQAILFHKYRVPLPTKKDVFDWTLGPDVSALREWTGADYALFIFVRDSYSSAGRIFVQLAAALLGVGVPGGIQLGFASLVDLRTGNIVWFNYLQSETGDLRTAEPAATTVERLLEGLPG